jgi:putative transposase
VAKEFAAASLGTSIRTIQRYLAKPDIPDGRKGAPKRVHNKLSEQEKTKLLALACSAEFQDLPPSQIVAILAQRGEYFGSERTLSRFLKSEKLNVHRRREKESSYRRPEPLVATQAGQVWSWDVTYLPSRVLGKHFYCYLFLDVFSRKIVGWEIHERECGKLASDLLYSACRNEGVAVNQLSLHQDNGAIMKGAEFLSAVSQLGISPSYSRPGVSDDNPFSESLFKTMKYRTWYPEKPFATLDSARQWMTKFNDWYNTKHLHSGLKYVTPSQRHNNDDTAILAARHKTYSEAKQRHPERWSGKTRNWEKETMVILNPRGKVA